MRFPLQRGVPAQRPDAVVRGLRNPLGLALDPQGRLYAVDGANASVAIYAAGAGNGSKPVRTLPIGHNLGIGSVSVDPLGYVYVAWSHTCTSEGFVCSYATIHAPFAQGLRRVGVLSFGGGPGGAFVRAMPVNGAEVMGETLGSQGVTFWYGLPGGQQVYPIFCGGVNPAGLGWGSSANEIIETDLGSTQPPNPPQIVVVPDFTLNSNCPPFYTITSATVPLDHPFALASHAGLIYVTSAYNKQLGSALIFVFDPSKAGSQTPIAIVKGAGSQLRYAPFAIVAGG